MRHTTNKNNPWKSRRSGFANKITKIVEIWIKRSVKQFLKSKSIFKNNIYRTVAFTQVL